MLVAQKVTTGVYKGVTTSELDELAAETAASMTASHPDYALVGFGGDTNTMVHAAACPVHGKNAVVCLAVCRSLPSVLTATMVSTAVQLAARIAVSNLHKNTLKSFSET